MPFLFKKVLAFTCGLSIALPVLGQHPNEVEALKHKLQQERALVKEQHTLPLTARAGKLMELGDWQAAQALLQQAQPAAERKLAEAKLAMLRHAYGQAEALVEQVLRQKPQLREAKLLLSRLQVQAWELEKAMATAQALLQKNPVDEEAALVVGRILMLQKKYDQALAWAQKVQGWNPKNAGAYLLESDVHFWNQKPELAEKPLITSLTLNPFDADARFAYGYAIWRRVDATQLNDMAAQWELALALNPLHYVTHWHWGNGHTNLTYADYAQPEDEQVRQALQAADKLLSESKIEQALRAAAQVQEQYPQSVLPAMLHGSAYYLAFDMNRQACLDSAQAIFQRILQKKKHYGPAHNAVAAVIKQRQLRYLHNHDSLQQVVAQTVIKDPINFARVFPDLKYYPGREVQQMVWSQLYESIVYFPFLSRQGETFVIPPLHVDLAIAMKSPYFRQATTFDNRQWMDIRGVGSGAAAIEYVVRGAYLERNVVLHEYVHLFHGRVFTDAENRQVRRLYHQAMQQGRTLDYYSANNEHEYLAQTYPAYFEPVKVHPLNHKSVNTSADLKAKDPELYAFLDALVQRQRAYLAGNKQVMASNWAQVYLNLAEKAKRGGELARATALLDTALSWDASYQPALISYAGVKQQQKDYGAAQAWLQKAKGVNAAYAPVYVAEAGLLEAQKLDKKQEQKSLLAQQVKLYEKALALEGDLLTRAAISEQVRAFYAGYGMVPEAIAVAEAYVKDAPTISTYLRDRRDEALAFAGWLKGTTQQTGEAEQVLAGLVARKPQDYELRSRYADVLAARGAYEKAYATLDEAQRILTAAGNPRPDYMVRMAEYKLQLNDTAAAGAAVAPLLTGGMAAPEEQYRLISVYAALGEVAQAEALFARLSKPATVVAAAQHGYALGRLQEAKGNARKAEKAYKDSLQLYPYQPEVRAQLVALLQKAGKDQKAEAIRLAGEALLQL